MTQEQISYSLEREPVLLPLILPEHGERIKQKTSMQKIYFITYN